MEKLSDFPIQSLPQAILDAFNSGIHVFTALRDKQRYRIVDFELVMMSKNSAALQRPHRCGWEKNCRNVFPVLLNR
jgi:hypothetical protein